MDIISLAPGDTIEAPASPRPDGSEVRRLARVAMGLAALLSVEEEYLNYAGERLGIAPRLATLRRRLEHVLGRLLNELDRT
jgi:hypothetical protein